jgi:hypothetical protein
MLTGGAGLSAGKERRGIPVRGVGRGGPWASSEAGPKRCPLALFYFYFVYFFFFFCFLISFISFAYLVQIASNQLCKVSKIQNNIPE